MTSTTFELSDQLVADLKRLVHLDIDASLAYAQAIDGVDEEHEDVRRQLEAFKGDHERHILELSNVLLALGHEPPEYKRDAKGFFIEGMTAIRAALGTRQALKAMRQNELMTNKRYGDALELTGLPREVMDIIVRARDDERRHLAFIEERLHAFATQASADTAR
jgi:hypothetical protein